MHVHTLRLNLWAAATTKDVTFVDVLTHILEESNLLVHGDTHSALHLFIPDKFLLIFLYKLGSLDEVFASYRCSTFKVT